MQVILTPAGGKDLLNTKTSSFPIETVNYSGITSPTGTLTYIYTVTIDETIMEDDDGNIVTIPARTEEHTIQKTVQFVKE